MNEPMEKVTLHDAPDVVDGPIALDRRAFFKGAGVAVLAVQCLPLITQASGHSRGGGRG